LVEKLARVLALLLLLLPVLLLLLLVVPDDGDGRKPQKSIGRRRAASLTAVLDFNKSRISLDELCSAVSPSGHHR
jgi:hypothetical protein